MQQRSKRMVFVVSFVAIIVFPVEGCRKGGGGAAPAGAFSGLSLHRPVSHIGASPPGGCYGGPVKVAPAGMNAQAQTMVSLINSYRGSAFGPNPLAVGVAQYHATDMAANDYVGLNATADGEDPFARYICSGGAAFLQGGVVAVVYTTDPNAAFAAMKADPGANAVLTQPGIGSISVGYDSGFWLIFLI